MTATTKTYLQRLPVAFGVLVIAYVLRYIFLHSFEVEPSAIYWPQFPAFFVTGAGILLALGILLDAIPTAGIAIMSMEALLFFIFYSVAQQDNRPCRLRRKLRFPFTTTSNYSLLFFL